MWETNNLANLMVVLKLQEQKEKGQVERGKKKAFEVVDIRDTVIAEGALRGWVFNMTLLL